MEHLGTPWPLVCIVIPPSRWHQKVQCELPLIWGVKRHLGPWQYFHSQGKDLASPWRVRDQCLQGRDGQSQPTPTHASPEKGWALHLPPRVVPSGFRSQGTLLPGHDGCSWTGGSSFLLPCFTICAHWAGGRADKN